MGNTFANSFFVAGDGFRPSRKYTYNKTVLITHSKCKLNEVLLKCILVHEEMPTLKNGVCQEARRNQAVV